MAFDPAKCSGCPIEGQFVPFEPTYSHDARFLVVVDPISFTGAKANQPVPKQTKAMFLKHAHNENIDASEFTYHPACLCPYPDTQFSTREKTAIHKSCRAHMLDAIEETQPDSIVAMGGEAAKQVNGRPVKITKIRGLGQKIDGIQQVVMPVLHPAQAVRYPENEPFLASDMAAFGRLIDAGFDTREANNIDIGKCTVVTDLQFLIDQDPELLCFDTETTGLEFFRDGVDVRTYNPALHFDSPVFKPRFQILCMSFTVASGEAYVLPWDMPGMAIPENAKPRLRNQLRRLLCKDSRLVVGHNLGFDNTALWMTEGIRFRISGDSLMLAAIHDENAMNKDLASMVKIHVPHLAGYSDHFDTKYDKSKMWQVPWADMVPYVGGDTIAGFDLYEVLEDHVSQDDGNWNHYVNVSLPGLNGFAGMETRGMHVDDEHALPAFRATLEAQVEEQRVSLISQIPREIKRKHVAMFEGKGGAEKALSLSRPDLIRDILFSHPAGFKLKPKVFTKTTSAMSTERQVPSTSSKDHLPYFFDECPFTMELASYVKNARLLSENIINFKNKYVVHSKVRPRYALTKTVTRRSSSSNPNGQNFPKRGKLALEYRKQFVAPPGYYILEVDLSQAELRIAGDMAKDPVIIDIYRRKGDIHTATAMIVKGVTQAQWDALPKSEQKDARTKAKAVNFGFLYGMGWRKFIGYAKTQYGAVFTEAEAKRVRTAFFAKYKGLAPWHERTRNFAKKHKYVRSYSGLMRHLPMVDSPDEGTQAEAGRQAINSPVQEFGSTLGVMAIGRMNEEIDPQYLEVVGFIHDAIVAYVKCEYVDWGMKTLKGYMESNPLKELFNLDMRIPIVAEAGFGKNLGEIIELPDFELDKPFDFVNSDSMYDKDTGEYQLDHGVPRQKTPPNNGRLTRSPYTTDGPEDQEDEDVVVVAPRRRRVYASDKVSEKPVKVRGVTKTTRRSAVAATAAKPVIRRRSRPHA